MAQQPTINQWTEEDQARFAESARENAIECSFDASDIPLRFIPFTMDSSPLKGTPAWERMNHLLTEADTEAWQEASIFLWGDYGRGKTALAVAYAQESVKAHVQGPSGRGKCWAPSILFRSVPDLLSELRASYGPRPEEPPRGTLEWYEAQKKRKKPHSEAELLELYTGVDLLILDDLGAEQVKDTGWLEDRLFQIVGKRHADVKATLFTSNKSLDDIASRIGDRLTWRIVEACGNGADVFHVTGPNLREQNLKKPAPRVRKPTDKSDDLAELRQQFPALSEQELRALKWRRS